MSTPSPTLLFLSACPCHLIHLPPVVPSMPKELEPLPCVSVCVCVRVGRESKQSETKLSIAKVHTGAYRCNSSFSSRDSCQSLFILALFLCHPHWGVCMSHSCLTQVWLSTLTGQSGPKRHCVLREHPSGCCSSCCSSSVLNFCSFFIVWILFLLLSLTYYKDNFPIRDNKDFYYHCDILHARRAQKRW